MDTEGLPDAGAPLPPAEASPFVERRAETAPQTITIPVMMPLNQHARVWMLLSGVLGIMLIAALVIVGYLWNVNGKWQDQVSSLTATGYDLGGRIAEHQKTIDQLNSTNALLSDQIATAKDKVLTLSNEKAQWSDQTAYAQQQVDLIESQIETAQTVIAQMGRCVEAEQQLDIYVAATVDPGISPTTAPTPGTYTPAEVAKFRKSVESLCTTATAATAAFQKSLTQ